MWKKRNDLTAHENQSLPSCSSKSGVIHWALQPAESCMQRLSFLWHGVWGDQSNKDLFCEFDRYKAAFIMNTTPGGGGGGADDFDGGSQFF